MEKKPKPDVIFLPMHLRVRQIAAPMHVERRNPAAVNAAAHFYGCAAHPGKRLQALLDSPIKLGQHLAVIGVPRLMQLRAHNQHVLAIHAHIHRLPVHQRCGEACRHGGKQKRKTHLRAKQHIGTQALARSLRNPRNA